MLISAASFLALFCLSPLSLFYGSMCNRVLNSENTSFIVITLRVLGSNVQVQLLCFFFFFNVYLNEYFETNCIVTFPIVLINLTEACLKHSVSLLVCYKENLYINVNVLKYLCLHSYRYSYDEGKGQQPCCCSVRL